MPSRHLLTPLLPYSRPLTLPFGQQPWQDFREPLYLLDKPVWVEDTRSEEEKKYPELFRRKLRGGWPTGWAHLCNCRARALHMSLEIAVHHLTAVPSLPGLCSGGLERAGGCQHGAHPRLQCAHECRPSQTRLSRRRRRSTSASPPAALLSPRSCGSVCRGRVTAMPVLCAQLHAKLAKTGRWQEVRANL